MTQLLSLELECSVVNEPGVRQAGERKKNRDKRNRRKKKWDNTRENVHLFLMFYFVNLDRIHQIWWSLFMLSKFFINLGETRYIHITYTSFVH